MRNVVLLVLFLSLVGCTTVAREQIKSVVTAQREHQEERDCECPVNIVIVNESD